MKNTLIKNFILPIYANKNNIIFECEPLDGLNDRYISMLSGFHLKELYLIEEDDSCFCGIRANHFCVEYGFSEYFLTDDPDREFDKLILITANHEGIRAMTLLKVPSEVAVPIFFAKWNNY